MGNGFANDVRIGAFELDLKAGELRDGNGTVRRLQEQPFQILLMLVDRSGGLVTREEIQKKLWPNDTVVEFDHSIHTAIKKLRQAFGDSGDDPKYIETVARRGYRLMAPVERLDGPAASPAVAEVSPPTHPPLSSTEGDKRVSHYRLLEVLGMGGMGVVYKAEDVKLGRRVALKFLPEDIARDAKALERFEREARAASALDHPNICTVYEFGEHEGHPFIAMALLEGETLRDRLGGRARPFSVPELLNLSIQIADGLSAAHEKGIIHRDIKPANIFITNKGEAKILDFGLAKLAEAGERANYGEENTLTARDGDFHLSHTGVAVGTVPYMSPEQVRGEKLDLRTDLFSLGLVIYEMATRKCAFPEGTAAQVHDAILNRSPVRARQLNPSISPRLEEIINKALERDREVRCQSAAEIRADLRRLKRDSESNPVALAAEALRLQPSDRHTRIFYGAALVALLIIVALGLGWRSIRRENSSGRGAVSERQLTRNTPENRALGTAISPDGKYLLYADPRGLHLLVLDTGETHDISLPQEIQTQLWDVAWFPDGERVLLTAQSKDGFGLWAISVFGGIPRKLATDARAAVVSPQGYLIAFIGAKGREVWLMGANGSNLRRFLTSDTGPFVSLAWSPTGERLAYIKKQPGSDEFGGSIETVTLANGFPNSVISDARIHNMRVATLLWAPSGRLIFAMRERPGSSDANLWEITVDPRTGKRSGRSTRITNWYGFSPWTPTLSKDGSRLVVTKARVRDDVYVADLKDGGTRMDSLRGLALSDSKNFVDAWSPDGKSVLFDSDRAGKFQIFKQQLNSNDAQLLIDGEDDLRSAILPPNGEWILYWVFARGDSPPKTIRLMRMRMAGGPAEQILEGLDPITSGIDCPSHSGTSCAFGRREKNDYVFYELDPIRGLGREIARTPEPVGTAWVISADGHRIAITVPEGLRLIDLPSREEHNLTIPGQFWSISWTADSKALIAALQSVDYLIVRIETNGEMRVLLDRGRNQWLGFALPSPDGNYLAFSQQSWDSNAWLLENF